MHLSQLNYTELSLIGTLNWKLLFISFTREFICINYCNLHKIYSHLQIWWLHMCEGKFYHYFHFLDVKTKDGMKKKLFEKHSF